MTNGFDQVMEKYGSGHAREPEQVSVKEESTSTDVEQGYQQLLGLLNQHARVIHPVVYIEGRYTEEGIGIHVDHRWELANQKLAIEVRNLFWSSAGELFMQRHRQDCFHIKHPLDWLPDDEVQRILSHGSSS